MDLPGNIHHGESQPTRKAPPCDRSPDAASQTGKAIGPLRKLARSGAGAAGRGHLSRRALARVFRTWRDTSSDITIERTRNFLKQGDGRVSPEGAETIVF